MSKFQLEAKQVQIITTEDGKEFTDMALAQAHQDSLDAAAIIAVPVEAYLNTRGMIDRNRKQKEGVAKDVLAFLVSAGVDLSGVEAVERTAFDTPAAEKPAASEEGSEETPAETPAASEEGEGEELF